MNANEIENAYTRLGYTEGWAFLMCPEARWRTAEVVTVGLNPGWGDETKAWDYPDGNRYLKKDDNKLYTQIQKMHDHLGVAEINTAAAQFIPFRTRAGRNLIKYHETLLFARRLWSWALEHSPARLFLCMGILPASEVAALLCATLKEERPAGWGQLKMRRFDTIDGRRVIYIPHLSRYALFTGDPTRAGISLGSIRELSLG